MKAILDEIIENLEDVGASMMVLIRMKARLPEILTAHEGERLVVTEGKWKGQMWDEHGLVTANEGECEWKLEDEDDMFFESSCGLDWSFPDGGTPMLNGMHYCPKCGRKLKDHPLPTPPEDK